MILIVLVACIGIGVRFLPDLEWVVHREDSIRKQIALAPLTSWALALVLYAALSLFPGTAGKSIIFGWLFGFVAALILVEIGLTAAAVVSFLLGRFVVKKMLHDRWRVRIEKISQRFARDGAFFLLWLRLAHAPFTLVNYAAGATSIPLVTFWWTTHLGILPATAVFTFVGSRIPNLRAVMERGAWALVDPPLVIVLVATAVLPMLVSPGARKLGKQLTE